MTFVRTLLEWTDAQGVDGMLEIDTVKTRGFEFAAEITEFPVESGSAIADNVRPTNGTVSLEGIISNSPLFVPLTQMDGATEVVGPVTLPGGDGTAKATMSTWSGPFDRRRACDTVLAGLIASSTPVRLTTSLRVMENLAIARYKVDESVDTGQALPIVLEFKALRIASTTRAPVPAVRRLVAPVPAGVQPPRNASAGQLINEALQRVVSGGRA